MWMTSSVAQPRPCDAPCRRPPAAARAAAAPTTAAGHRCRRHSSSGRACGRRRSGGEQLQRLPPCRATDFHQSQLAATERGADAPPLAALDVREAEGDEELQAASWLRALSFYRYPEERKFAAQVHRLMVAEEEFKELKVAALNRRLGRGDPNERSACLVALCPAAQLEAGLGDAPHQLDERLVLGCGGGTGSGGTTASAAADAAAAVAAGARALVGTLDVYAVRALQGEVLIGDSRNAAYLANVCTAGAARRRGVGQVLLQEARRVALGWGVDALYVHTMAVNEIAVRFYERNGFVVEKEESSNQAHYRGRCLDGIEGRGRTVLMRDTRLRA